MHTKEIHPKYTVENSASGAPVIVVSREDRSLPLHSLRDPVREKQILDASILGSNCDTLIVLGLGSGYHLQNLKEHARKFNRIVVIEHLRGVESAIKRCTATSFLTEIDNMSILSGFGLKEIQETLKSLLTINRTSHIQIVNHPNSFRLFESYYISVQKIITDLIEKSATNQATIQAFGMRYLRNVLKNSRAMFQKPDVSELFNSFNGVPGIVIASGPSLDRYIDVLGKVQNSCVLVAVDSAVPALLSRGIEPHIVVAVDPQAYIWEHLQTAPLDSMITVASVTSDTRVFNTMRGFVAGNTHPLFQLISSYSSKTLGSIDSKTGSVAGDALNLGILMGMDPICLLGFDSSFINHTIYAQGTTYQNRYAGLFQNRIKPIETQNLSYIYKSSNAYRYEDRLTRKTFIGYKKALERYCTSQSGKELFLCNSPGISITGMNSITDREFLNRFSGNYLDSRSKIEKIYARASRINDVVNKTALLQSLNDMNLFRELCSASLGKRADMNTIKKIESLCRNTLLKEGTGS